MTGYTIAGGILASMLCAKFANECSQAGGSHVVAGAIAGGLYSGWDFFKTKILKLDP